VVRRIGIALTALGAVLFTLMIAKVMSGSIPSECSGSECFHGPGLWLTALPASIFLFVGGIVMISFGGRGFGRTAGPKDFAQVDSGAFAPGSSSAGSRGSGTGARPVSSWSRSWRNIYVYTGLGESALAVFFFAIGARQPEARGGMYLTGAILGLIGVILLFVGAKAASKDRLHQTGIEAEAKIVGLTQTGMWMNNNPYVKLDLIITVPGHPPYEVKHGEIVPQVLIGSLTDGSPLHVKVDPNRPSHFVIEWERG
jgi:hypothetical protein